VKRISFFYALILTTLGQGQSLIVGIPSADVADFHHIEMTHETQWSFWNKPRKWTSFNFFCYGIGKNAELTLVFNNINSKGSDNLAIGVGGKKVFQLTNSSHPLEQKLTFGSNLLYSTNREKFGVWAYSHYSFRIPKIKSRITAGLNYGQSQIFGFRKTFDENNQIVLKERNQFTFIGGIEQPIYKNYSIVADWYSGTHDIAALIIGAQAEIRHNILILGYKIPNNKESGSQAIIIEFMISLPSDRKVIKK
jgi:hypothetical protein